MSSCVLRARAASVRRLACVAARTVAEHFKPRPRARTRPHFRISLDTFHAFLALSPACEAAYTAVPRGFLEVFLDDTRAFLLTEFARAYDLKEEDHLDVDVFEAEAEPLPSEESATPKFACTDLVETSCDDPCDWHEAFHGEHDFSEDSVANASKQRVFMKTSGDAEDDFVHTTQFFSYVYHEVSAAPPPPQEDEPEPSPKTCSVIGCQQPFPTTHPHGWSITCAGSGQVCSNHQKRYQRYEQRARKARKYSDDGALQSLWTEQELAEDARRQRAFVSDVPPISIETVQLQ